MLLASLSMVLRRFQARDEFARKVRVLVSLFDLSLVRLAHRSAHWQSVRASALKRAVG